MRVTPLKSTPTHRRCVRVRARTHKHTCLYPYLRHSHSCHRRAKQTQGKVMDEVMDEELMAFA